MEQGLTLPGDPAAYCKTLLQNTLVSLPSNAPPLPERFTLQQHSSQAEVVKRAVEVLVCSSCKSSNLLCLGFRKSMHGAEQRFPNTTTPTLCAPPWPLLLSRLGDTLMLYLLLHATIFVPLPNCCYLQVAGPPVAQRVWAQWRVNLGRPSLHPGAAALPAPAPMRDLMPATQEGSGQGDGLRLPAASGSPVTQGTQTLKAQASVPAAQGGDAASGAAASMSAEVSGRWAKRSARQSSWQRRRAALRRIAGTSGGSERRRGGVAGGAGGRAPRGWVSPAGDTLPRWRTFYCASFCPSPGLPKGHVLNQLAGTPGAPRVLHAAIFRPEPSPPRRPKAATQAPARAPPAPPPAPPRRIPRRHRAVLPLLQQHLRRSQSCPYSLLLDHHCPLPACTELIRACVPHTHVVSFVWAVIRRIVPRGLLGDVGNQRALRFAIDRLVGLRRHEQLRLAQALHGVRGASLPALLPPMPPGPGGRPGGVPPSLSAARARRLAQWVRWLFNGLAIPLLRAHFYVTESEAYRNLVFYYRKPVWARLRKSALDALRSTLFTPVTAEAARRCLQARQLGFARIRLLPKRTGMRPIANMGGATHVRFQPRAPRGQRRPRPVRLMFRSANSRLRNAFQVLKFEARRAPGILGASVFGYGDAYARLQPVLRRLRAAAAAAAAAATPTAAGAARLGTDGKAAPKFFIVAADFSGAFDNVCPERALALAEGLLQADEYVVASHDEVLASTEGATRAVVRAQAGPAGPCQTLSEGFPARAGALARGVAARVFADRGPGTRVQRGEVVALLRQHLRNNLVRMGGRWHVQSRGIPQGSMLSTLLCSLYLGALEAQHLQPLLPAAGPPQHASSLSSASASTARLSALAAAADGSDAPATPASSAMRPPALGTARGPRRRGAHLPSVLLRLVDDFLVITPLRAAAEALALRLLHGFPDYNMRVNPAKTRVTFDLRPGPYMPRLLRNTVVDGCGTEFVPWCGLLIAVRTLEVQADYGRYVGAPLAASLTLPPGMGGGRQLAAKLKAYLRPKCHAALLDPAVNSPATVRLNLYQVLLLAAMKLHCHAAALGRPSSDPRALLAAIHGGLAYLVRLVRLRVLGARRRFRVDCRECVSGCHIRWLGFTAFRRALGRKQARYAAVLAALDMELRAPVFRQVAVQLAPVVDPRRSSVFDSILY
ncbi:hypothetical protein WJX81_001464 [Elliptochloris bilobata]|uniref:Telomerase reverse transcriptase n=1 Tax=Elliptochloris bilobata TaxID=381761 RepID=A0AAW1S9G7_9CHLO